MVGSEKWLKITPNGAHAENVYNGSLAKCISFQHDCFVIIFSCKRVAVTGKNTRIMQRVLLEHSGAVSGAKSRLIDIFEPKLKKTFLRINCICRMFFASLLIFK